MTQATPTGAASPTEQSASASAWAAAVTEVAVVGAGAMGEGIAQGFAEAGLQVRLLDVAREALDRCRAQIAANLALAAECGLGGDEAEVVLARIRLVETRTPVDEVGAAALVVETVPEILELKRALFADLDRLADDVLIGSNTSSMTMSSICAGMTTPQRVVGLHYFNPAHIIPAVEIHRGERTTDAAVARARALMLRTGKAPFLVRKEIPGFVVNRLTAALMREIYDLLDQEVVTPEELDIGVKASLGFRMAWSGPMESADFTGLDVGVRVVSALLPELSTRTEPSKFLIEKVAAGDLGVKTGRGWLDHHGQTRAALLHARNARLLRQLKSWREVESTP